LHGSEFVTVNSGSGILPRPVLAAHHWSIFDLEVDAACAWAAQHGYAGLDLAIGDFGSGPRIDVETLAADAGACDRLAASAASRSIVFTDLVVGVIWVPGSTQRDRDSALELFARFAPRASRLGLDGVTLLPGIRGDADRDELFSLIATELRRHVAIGAEYGVGVSIEAHLESVTDTPGRTLEMLEAVPGLTLTLDYSHFIHPGFTHDDIEPLDSHARHFHIRQAAPDRLAIEVDRGTIDHARLVAHLATIGYRGSLATEYVDSEWYDQNLVDTVAENAAMRDEIAHHLDVHWPQAAR
jgi:sugar phosphate isomerase/epimerase